MTFARTDGLRARGQFPLPCTDTNDRIFLIVLQRDSALFCERRSYV